MQVNDWHGVIPAITTPFKADLSIDREALEEHVDWMIGSGCHGIVALGSLGEAATLSFPEKLEVLKICKDVLRGRAPLVAGIAALSTEEAVLLADGAYETGCDGLMVLPPYVYRGDWRETKAHMGAVIEATPLSCMLYNNPLAYGTDIIPYQIGSLAEQHPNLHAVKESSGDVRRVMAVREVVGERLTICVGVDDCIVESIAASATGWIAGLVNAFPVESVQLFELAARGNFEEARKLYEWFLPLLRMDTVPKFVQLIKLVQAELGRGSAIVRPPRLELTGIELDEQLGVIRAQIATRPGIANHAG
jgi:dihydrodipicolinate synthase/N-acetylneuraminate lyase